MKLPTLKKNQKIFSSLDKNFGRMKSINTSCMTAAIFTGLLISSECLAESLRLPGAEYSAEFSNIARANLYDVELSFFSKANFLHQSNSQRVGNGIELLAYVPVNCQPMATISTKSKGNNRPDKRDEGGVSVKQDNELTPEGTHKFWRLLLIQIAIGAIVVPVGMYFGLRIVCSRDYAQGNCGGKVHILALLSILTVPSCLKSRRWKIWEQRNWFREMKMIHGIGIAYLETRYWKKRVSGLWG